jgi:hypothetical protein
MEARSPMQRLACAIVLQFACYLHQVVTEQASDLCAALTHCFDVSSAPGALDDWFLLMTSTMLLKTNQDNPASPTPIR